MVKLAKQEPEKVGEVKLSKSSYQQRTTQLDNTNTKIDPSKLSVVSKNYLRFKNIFGFRPLVIHPSVTSCLPYQAAREKRQSMILDLLKQRADILTAIEVDIKSKTEEESKRNIAHYTSLFNEESDGVKKMNYQSMIEAEKRHLETMKNKKVTETDLRHPDLLAIDEQIEKLNSAQLHIKNSGTCQSCGVTLPDSMEKHIDFVTSETRLLCPFCHLTEHIDEAAELRAGYIGYMPNISQEQINLFTYCYFILKHIIEMDPNLPEDLKEKLRAFAKRPISKQVEDITYEKLYQSVKAIRQTMKLSGNLLIEFFKYKANIDKAHLTREFEEKNDVKIEGNIEDYLVEENRKYEDRKFTFDSDNYYSFNIDNMNLPEFYAGIMISNGVSLYSPTSVEEKLNVITRLDGIRFIPSYTFFKPYLNGWQKQLLTKGFEAMMANFFVVFEDLIVLKKGYTEEKNEAEEKTAENSNTAKTNSFEQQTTSALQKLKESINQKQFVEENNSDTDSAAETKIENNAEVENQHNEEGIDQDFSLNEIENTPSETDLADVAEQERTDEDNDDIQEEDYVYEE